MGRRIEVELTSARDDGSWTWRVAGARQPKGELTGDLLYDGAQVGDVVKAEAEFHVDGIEITEVFAPKKKKERSDLLELKSRPLRDDELVTTQRASRGDRRGGRRGDRDGRRGRRDDDRGGRSRSDRASEPQRPKPKRIRPKRTHRDALLADVGDEHRPIVEQVMAEGMPGVRAAIDKQNAEAKAADKPEIDAAPILAIAEKNLQKARLAEWRDRADAALEISSEVDLRDLRSVVVAGNDVARDPESKEVAEQLKTALDERVEADHTAWLTDLDAAVTEGRVVRALRLSSRPVKAGAPLPPELASTLAEQASQAMSSDVGQERWATVLDALAFSPVRGAVTPVGTPPEPKSELIDAVKRVSDRVPTIAAMFGVDPAEVPRSARRRRSSRDRRGRGGQQGGRGGGRQDGGRSEPRSRADGGKPDKQAELEIERPTEQTDPGQPGATQASTEQPTATEQPETGQPETRQPTATEQPETGQPETRQPTATEQPETGQPETRQPTATEQPETGQPEPGSTADTDEPVATGPTGSSPASADTPTTPGPATGAPTEAADAGPVSDPERPPTAERTADTGQTPVADRAAAVEAPATEDAPDAREQPSAAAPAGPVGGGETTVPEETASTGTGPDEPPASGSGEATVDVRTPDDGGSETAEPTPPTAAEPPDTGEIAAIGNGEDAEVRQQVEQT